MLKVLSPSPTDTVPPTAIGTATEILWIDAQDPTPEEMNELAARFGWHPLSIEDALRVNQRPKVDAYEDYEFVVTYTARYEDEDIKTTELDIFVGSDYLVSSHKGPLPDIEEARRRWESHSHLAKDASPIYLLYALLDAVVDDYFPTVEALSEVVEGLEEKLFDTAKRDLPRELVEVRRDLLTMSRVIAPERDVVDHILRSERLVRHPELAAYFTDIHDHLLRLNESLTLQRELLSNLQVSLSLASNELNQILKVLTSASIILMSIAVIAGVYSMNFENMPELEWQYGYAFAIGLMVAVGAGIAFYLRRRGWF